jgi:transposase
MRQRFGGQRIAVGIEAARGAVIWALMGYEHIVLYPINPSSAARFREAFYPSGKKDDPVDAEMLCEMTAKHWAKLRAFAPADAQTRELGLLSEGRRKLVNDRTRLTNRLIANLKAYYPQALELVGKLDTSMACAFLQRWPTFDDLKPTTPDEIRKFYVDHGCRKEELIVRRLAVVESSVTLTTDVAVMSAGRIRTLAMTGAIAALLEAIDLFDQRLSELYLAHPEHDWIDSFPGVGSALGPRLLAILGTDRSRFATAGELQRFTGVAPVTFSTGGSKGSKTVLRRVRRSKFVHQTVVEWAAHFCQFSDWGRAYYAREAARGRTRWAILRSLGFKLLRIVFRCWQSHTPYSEQTHQRALVIHGSALAKELVA